MNRIKKLFVGIGAFFSGLFFKLASVTAETKYGVARPQVETKYGVLEPQPSPTPDNKILALAKFAVPGVLFVIGLFVLLNKKITKKVKIMVISILVALAVVAYLLLDYFA